MRISNVPSPPAGGVGSVTKLPQASVLRPREAVRLVAERFPLKDYVNIRAGSHLNIATAVARHAQQGAKILDFGAGPCDKTAVLQAMGFECHAYDDLQDAWHGQAQRKILDFAASLGIQFTLAREGQPLPFPRGYFDMVVMTDVIEHIHDSPRELLNDLLELAKPSGLLLITVPNAANIRKRTALLLGRTNYQHFDMFYWYPGAWRGHVREYVKNDLTLLAEYLNLEILELRGCDHMLLRLNEPIRSAYLGITNIMHSWKDSWLLVARKRNGWHSQRTMPPGMTLSSGPTTYLYGD
jgi:2-polyprenyl-3-methyl-5-hydroxy-6-metoxy-1,4-benzoquinol methylase